MEFESTLKEYFKYPNDFEKKYQAKLNKEDTIIFDFKISNYPAFIHFNAALYNLIYSIQQKNNTLNCIYLKLPPIASGQYIRNSLVADIKNTNAIEQVFSSRKDIFELAEDFKKRQNDKIGSVVSKYLMLLNDKKIKTIHSCEEIRLIFNEMFNGEYTVIKTKDWPDGVLFRKGFVGVFDDLKDEPIHKGIIPEEEIIRILNIGIDLLNDDEVNIFIKTAAFHYIFEYVHPFYDGNGRVGRYITSLLIKNNVSDIFAFRISSICKEYHDKYYKLFEQTDDIRNRGDITTFIYGFLSLLDKGYDNCIKYAKSKVDELDKLINEIGNKYPKFKNGNISQIVSILAQASVFSDFGISIKNIAETMDVNEKTIRRNLEEIKNSGILKTKKHGKFIYYMIDLQK